MPRGVLRRVERRMRVRSVDLERRVRVRRSRMQSLRRVEGEPWREGSAGGGGFAATSA
jgi:hypothetical protein